MKKLLAFMLLVSSTAIAQEKWDYKQDVVFDSTHDPSLVFLKDGRKIEVFYDTVKWEDASKWKAGRALSIVYRPDVGVVFFDPASSKKLSILKGLAEHPIDMIQKKCSDKAVTNPDISGCYHDALERWDKELNLHYKQLLSQLEPKGKEELKQAQRAWIKFRDLQKQAIETAYSNGGQMGGFASSSILVKLTKSQAMLLNDMVNQN